MKLRINLIRRSSASFEFLAPVFPLGDDSLNLLLIMVLLVVGGNYHECWWSGSAMALRAGGAT
jgi:hypothetical protein